MQSLVPRAIPIIEFGTEEDNCAVAKYKTNKMVNKRSILAANSIFLALVSLAAVPQVFTWQKVGPPWRVTLPSR